MATEEVNGEAMPWGKARVFTMVFDCIFAPWRIRAARRRRAKRGYLRASVGGGPAEAEPN